MRIIRPFSASVVCSPSVVVRHQSFIKTAFSLKSMFSSTIAKTRVLLRTFIKKTSGGFGNGFDSLSPELTTRIVPLSRDSQLKYSSNINRLINRLLNGERILINRVISKWNHSNLNPNKIIGSAGLSLGLVGVCVKRNGPTLITETDVMETHCQEVRNIFSAYRQMEFHSKTFDAKDLTLDKIEFGSCIAKGCNGVVYKARLRNDNQMKVNELAVKMLFNYDAESNAAAIWKAMNKECVPFSGDFAPQDSELSKILDIRNGRKLVPHPNIVQIYGVFADSMPQLEDAHHLYPDALPIRLGGFARNMTLFIVEKRYDMSLKQYLSSHKPTTITSTVMLTQLLEAVSFLVKCQISHRDLKTDNILLTLNPNNDIPWLVVTDFGFCLTTLSLPFNCDEICRGGNRALMAPEIISAKCGAFTKLDYSSADLWAVGAIAYEIFNGLNPFYPYPERQQCLQSISYEDSQLPETPQSMPPFIGSLVRAILSRNPYEVIIKLY